MKRSDLFELLKGLKSVKNLRGVKFAYGAVKNKHKVEAEIECLKEVVKPSEKYDEFDKKRMEICEKYCSKDKEGKSIIKGNVYEGLKDNRRFDKEIKRLRKDYQKVIEERKTQLNEYNKMLEEEIKIDFHKVLLKDVPEDISSEQLEKILPIIDDEK